MDLFDILLVKKLIGKINSEGEVTDEELQKIIEQLEEKVSRDEMKVYVNSSIENLPTLNEEEILKILK